ncbi:hypothetical protein BGZ63DRAFT_350150 [Mariannaea sp. PMI_226]|nr:hypothetical protein BGZ63DRAFT_350150 [Mariannaea sp. PMI_226]
MTSRSHSLGVQPRPPQRTVSSSSLPSHQRPPPQQQRSVSQQQQPFIPASPIRKDSNFIDLTGDASDATPSRFTSTPRRGGSRLKLELSISNDPYPEHISITSSPRSLTPSRINHDAFETSSTSPANSKASQDFDNPPLPMPKRRPRPTQPVTIPRVITATSAPIKKDSRPKPYTVEIPPLAPRYLITRPDAQNRNPVDPFSKGLNSGYADFFPWTGTHHEDEWNSEAIIKGTWDKQNHNHPESASAKMAIFPALKQKSGLNALSTVFMTILNQRRHRGQINAPSTFKPPPRVTLTDTKREVWLKDLANPAISLRRLSRTIPHGIRGRTLLDQCLNKNVPIERAVWLAKCVGANEIRAFKRKGVNGAFVMGGELKWSRDWTVFVEQFVDGVVSTFGQNEWKNRVTYAIRLAMHLYSEQLLDRDHYLDWIVSGIESSPQARVPMWILIAEIYWKDLLRSRKFGRRLVFAIFNRLDVIHNDPDRDILVQLSSRLAHLLHTLVKTNAESFISPNAWQKYRAVLHVFLTPDEATQKAIDEIQIRNSRLLVTSSASPPAGRNQLVRLLDAALKSPTDRELAAKCWATSDNKPQTMKTLVEWATSFHRPGLAKVYVAANLIRAWSSFRTSPTTPILEILDGIDVHDKTRKEMVYLLVTELVRTGHFSVPQYIQWVIARGGYHEEVDIDPEQGPCWSRLLVELPLHALSEAQRIERGDLLRRAGNYSIADEEQNITNALKCLKQALGLPLPPGDPLSERKPLSLNKLLKMIRSSSKALRSCIGFQLRDNMVSHFAKREQPPMSLSMFTSIRDIMEAVEDFSMLSDILKACTKSTDTEILASCADTVNSNLQTFFAIGSADTIFNSLIERLVSINEDQGVVPRPLLAALSGLAQRMTGHEAIANQLRQELLQSDKSNATDACSPVSDMMAAPSQSVEGGLVEDVEKLLSSGTRLDPPNMNRLFRTIIPRLERGWWKKNESRRVLATLLSRIRVFDTQHFDKLMTDWTSHVRSLPERPGLADLFPLLISTGCLAMPIILSTASAPTSAPTPEAASKPHGHATYLQELLQLIITPLPSGTGLTAEERYRFRTEQRCARFEQSKGLLNLIKNALLEYCSLRDIASGVVLLLDNPPCQDSLLETLRQLVLADSAAVSSALSLKSLPEAGDLVQKVTTNLLIPGNFGTSPMSFDSILQLANEMTLPFCQLKLNLDLSIVQQNTGEGDGAGSQFELFAKAMDRAIESGNIMWTSLIPCLSDDITQHLKNQAHTGFLELIPSSKGEEDLTEAASQQMIHRSQNFLEVIEAIISGQPPPKTAQLSLPMIEKLIDLWEIVIAGPDDRPEIYDAVIHHWLPAMLHFITLHSVSSEPPSAPLSNASAAKPHIPNTHDTRARVILVLCALMLELESIPPDEAGTLAQQVMDLGLLLVDTLPEDLRAQCAKTVLMLPGHMPSLSMSSDPRLYYLFSTPPLAQTDCLMLSHREKATTPQSAAFRGVGAMYGIGPVVQERLTPFVLRRWEVLSEPTPNIGENDTSLSLGLFESIKI